MSDQILHECGIALIRLRKPLSYYIEKYGPMYAVNKMYILMEKQHNRGQDGAGVAARAVDGMLADPPQQLAGTMRLAAQRAGQDIAEGERQIAAGVAVRNRENIDFIQVVALRNHPARTRNQRSAQHRGTYHGDIGLQAQCIHQWFF
mgnify:CR=1 FL=1